jgi:putative flippase GtrA
MTLESVHMRREMARFLKFAVVGTLGAVIDFGTFNLLQAALGVSYLLSGAISFTVAVSSNFIWNRFWTYPDSRSKPISVQVSQFFLVNVVGLIIRIPVLAIAERPMIRVAESLFAFSDSPAPGLPTSLLSLDAATAGRNLALALTVVIVLFWNFGINRVWTYSDVS